MKQPAALRRERLRRLPGPSEHADGAEFADQHPAHQAVTADDDLPVGAAGGIGEPHHVVTGQRDRLAEGGDVQGGGGGGGGADG